MYSNSKKVEGLEISDEILETLDYKNYYFNDLLAIRVNFTSSYNELNFYRQKKYKN